MPIDKKEWIRIVAFCKDNLKKTPHHFHQTRENLQIRIDNLEPLIEIVTRIEIMEQKLLQEADGK